MLLKPGSQVSQPKMSTRLQAHLGKGHGKIMYNVEDVREITYIGTSLTKEKERGMLTTFRGLK
jgi:hypothetical protein